jgi:site-specific DNA recombinase
VVYAGRVRYKLEVHAGEHEALVDLDTWQRVQAMLQRNGKTGGSGMRNKFGALLKGLVRCQPCGCAMTPAHTTKGSRRYRYYTCINAQKRGWHACQSKSVPAAELEKVVLQQIRCVGRDEALVRETLAQARREDEERGGHLDGEQRLLVKDLGRWHAEMQRLAVELAGSADKGGLLTRLAVMQERIAEAETRLAQVRQQLEGSDMLVLEEQEIAESLARFDPVWEALTPHEQGQVLRLLIERVDYDGKAGQVAITFHRDGLQTLSEHLARHHEKKGVSA